MGRLKKLYEGTIKVLSYSDTVADLLSVASLWIPQLVVFATGLRGLDKIFDAEKLRLAKERNEKKISERVKARKERSNA